MSGKVKKVPYVIEVLMIGVHPGDIRYCLFCRQPFQIGEAWRKITRLGRDGYSLGVHETCWADHIEAGASTPGGQDV